jgi:UDP-N-acetyl-2-amino-2-deoxyglucuronate dehydrogenase
MSSTLGFAIVGCGMIARYHTRALAEVPHAKLAALVTRSPANAAKLLEETGTAPVPVFATLEEALKHPAVDVVIITTPSGAHLEPAVAAAEAKKHVVVEKPLEITTERCDRIIAACDRNGVKLCTIFPVSRCQHRPAGCCPVRAIRTDDPGRNHLQMVAFAGVLR